jgi:hypothetical protein
MNTFLYKDFIIIGTISVIFAFITNYILDEITYHSTFIKTIKEKGVAIFICVFFLFGVLFHIVIRMSGITEWQCKKICYDDYCEIVCSKKII